MLNLNKLSANLKIFDSLAIWVKEMAFVKEKKYHCKKQMQDPLYLETQIHF